MNLRRIFFVTLCVITILASTSISAFALEGRLIDKRTGLPIAGAEVDQPASITTNLSGADTPFSTLQVRSGHGTGQSTYSNIVFATEFSDVVSIPEPSSLALAALGGLALILRRRK